MEEQEYEKGRKAIIKGEPPKGLPITRTDKVDLRSGFGHGATQRCDKSETARPKS